MPADTPASPPPASDPGRTAPSGGPSAPVALALFLILTVLCTWPLARDARTHTQDLGDPLLEVVVLTWGSHALLTPGDTLLDAPQFYPYDRTAMYQNSFFGQIPLFAPVWMATGNPILAFQCAVLAALFLCGICMWWTVRALTGNSWAGILAGTLFAFHQYRFRNLQHLQVMSIWWWPLAIWAVESFLLTRRWRSVLLLAFAGVAQFYCSIYMGAMLLGFVLVRLAVEVLVDPERLLDRQLWRRGVLTLGLAAAALAPLALPYLQVVRQFPPAHDLDTIVAFSTAPRDYLRLGLSSVPYYWLRAHAPWHYTFDQFVLFPGLVATVLGLYGLVTAEGMARRTRAGAARSIRRLAFALVLTAAIGIILSAGPYLKQHGRATELPLPALWLLQHIPGYTVFRVNTRFAFLVLLALSVGIGEAYATFVQRRTLTARRRLAVGVGLLALILLENWNAPVPTVPVPVAGGTPAVYAALAEDPDRGPILEVPFGNDLYQDIGRVYAGLAHGRRTVNGYSTVEPPGHAQFAALAANPPTEALWAALAAWDVRTLVVHYADMPPSTAALWRAARATPGIRVWHESDGVDIWKLDLLPQLSDHPIAGLTAGTFTANAVAPVTLRFSTPDGTVWRCPRPLGLRDTTVTWQRIDSGAFVEDQARTLVPLFVVGSQPIEARVDVHAPALAGTYTLRVDCGVAVAEARVDVRPAVEPKPDQT